MHQREAVSGIAVVPAVPCGQIQDYSDALVASERPTLFLRDRFVHNDGSFLLCNISKDALDDFVLYGENINFLVRVENVVYRAASDNP